MSNPLVLSPDGLVERLEWKTDILTSLNGSEQRISYRKYPRRIFTHSYIPDSDEEVQNWKYYFAKAMSGVYLVPLWGEAMKVTAAVPAGGTTVSGDYSRLDDTLGNGTSYFLLVSPDGGTSESFYSTTRTTTLVTRSVGTHDNAYPVGSWIVPMEYCFTENGGSYQPFAVNAAQLDVVFTMREYYELEGKNPTTHVFTTHNGKLVLDIRPLGDSQKETFWENMERIDYGNVIEVLSIQSVANINSARQYISKGDEDRQWWKAFLNQIQGQRKSFYAPTYKEDLTVTVQPTQGGSNFTVKTTSGLTANVWWENIQSHKNLAIFTVDGAMQLKEVHPDTVNNGDGTVTVELTTGLTNTADGSTIESVSFLELVRLGSDTVEIEHRPTHRVVSLLLRTIQE